MNFKYRLITLIIVAQHINTCVADIEDTEVIWIALLRDTQINWFYLKIEQNKNNINNYTYK